MIKHRPGDILEPSGCIFIEVGHVQHSGVVVIHRSRLRRAKRFGWIEVDQTIGIRLDKPVEAHLVAVARV